jgi:conserved hypothetical protein
MNKKVILGILISIISIGLVYWSVKEINLRDAFNALKNIQLSYVLFFVILVIIMQWLRSYRWGVILQPMEKIDQFSLFSVTCVGFLAIAAIPARIGEVARPYLISQKSSIKMSSALGTILIERVLDFFSVLTIAVVVLFHIDNVPPWMIVSSILLFSLALVILCCILGLIWRREKSIKIINIILGKFPGKFAHKIDELIHHFIDGFQVITNIKLLLYLFFLSALIWLVDVLAIYMLLVAFGFNLPTIASFVVMIFLIAGIAIPAAPGYVGTWDLACVRALVDVCGLAKADALSFAVVYHFLSMAIVVVLGFIFLPFNKFSISDMKSQLNYKKVNENLK